MYWKYVLEGSFRKDIKIDLILKNRKSERAEDHRCCKNMGK